MSIRIEAKYPDGSISEFNVEYVVGASFRKDEMRPISFRVPMDVLTEGDMMYLKYYVFAGSENPHTVMYYN